MNKLVTILQCTYTDIISIFYNPIKALKNLQRKKEREYLKAYLAYEKSSGNLEILKGNLTDVQKKITNIDLEIDKICSTDDKRSLKLATDLILYQKQEEELIATVEENEINLEVAKKAINAMEILIRRNEDKITNLKIKQQMNKTAKTLLSLLKLDKNKIGELSIDSVNKQLTDEMRYINGERKALQSMNNDDSEEISIESQAKIFLENKKQLLIEQKR